ncbi:hypothetical protein BJY59DRAFT_15497 [Rhodotorula toruloides]
MSTTTIARRHLLPRPRRTTCFILESCATPATPTLRRTTRSKRRRRVSCRLGRTTRRCRPPSRDDAKLFRRTRSPRGRMSSLQSTTDRLQREASSRRGKFALRRRPTVDSFEGEYDSDDFESDISSDYDHLNHSLRRSSDYYPLSIRARYRPRMVVARVTDSVVQKIVSFVTWIRFFTILGMAIVFAVWQGPQKTLGIVDRRRRIR